MHKVSKHKIHDYEKEEQVNKLTLKLKNAVMVYWLKVKAQRKKKSFDDIFRELQAQKRLERDNAQAFKEAKKKQRLERKETRR